MCACVCPGTSQPVGGMAASIVVAAGLPELAVADWADYERLAIALATDANRRGQLRQRLTLNIREGKVKKKEKKEEKNIERARERSERDVREK